jgi:hypothetical protein
MDWCFALELDAPELRVGLDLFRFRYCLLLLFANREVAPRAGTLSCYTDPALVALLELGLLTTQCHFLRLFDLLSGHV